MESSRSIWKVRAALGLALLITWIGIVLANFTGPPLGVTGDFGERSCNQSDCHEGNPINATGGSLTISGVPAQYVPGQTYTITVTINRTNQRRWGFELAVRAVSNGLQAGTLIVTNGSITQIRTQNGIQYISHNAFLGSTFPGEAGPKSWSFNWQAPPSPIGAIRFGCAGNAANNNNLPSGDFIYTTTATTNPPSASNPITGLFSQVAVGGGYSTIFTLMNTGSTEVSGDLVMRDQQGQPFDVDLTEPSVGPESPSGGERINAVGSSFPVSVPPGGTKFFIASAPNASDPTTSGWARVESSGGSLGGVGTFQFAEGGALKTIAGVLASQIVEFATIPVDNDDGQNRFTGFAVANTSNEDLSIRLVTLNEDGSIADNILPSQLNPLGPQKQIAIFLHQILGTRLKFRGSMVLVGQGGKKFAVVALVLNQDLLTAIPVIPEKAPSVPN